jgi:hypothetical protein
MARRYPGRAGLVPSHQFAGRDLEKLRESPARANDRRHKMVADPPPGRQSCRLRRVAPVLIRALCAICEPWVRNLRRCRRFAVETAQQLPVRVTRGVHARPRFCGESGRGRLLPSFQPGVQDFRPPPLDHARRRSRRGPDSQRPRLDRAGRRARTRQAAPPPGSAGPRCTAASASAARQSRTARAAGRATSSRSERASASGTFGSSAASVHARRKFRRSRARLNWL